MKKIKKRMIIYLIVTIILIVTISCFKVNKTSIIGNANDLIVPFVKEGDIFQSEFVIPYNNFNKIGIKFATYLNDNVQGYANITILDIEKEEYIYNEDCNLKEISDNQFFYFELSNQKKSKDKKYLFTIKINELQSDVNLGIYGYKNDDDTIMNSDNYNLGFIYGFKETEKLLYLYILYFWGIILIIESLLNFKTEGVKKSNEINRKTRKHKIKK